jgi:hypothetical protein
MIKFKKSKNLVISTVGDSSLHKFWCNKNNKFDTFLIYYGDKNNYKNQSTYYKKAKGYKYHLIKDVLEEMPELFKYDYIWLPDDDVAANITDVEKLFSLMELYNLDLAQPSIMGHYGAKITLNQIKSKIRFTNWVEIMCPCFSSRALKICKEVFKENNCGWSIEQIWNVLLEHPKDKIAIIDDIVVFHTRKGLTGDTYKDIKNPLKFALSEANKIYKKWNLFEEIKKDLKFGKLFNEEIFGVVIYDQIMSDKKEEKFFPKSDFLEKIFKSFLYS